MNRLATDTMRDERLEAERRERMARVLQSAIPPVSEPDRILDDLIALLGETKI